MQRDNCKSTTKMFVEIIYCNNPHYSNSILFSTRIQMCSNVRGGNLHLKNVTGIVIYFMYKSWKFSALIWNRLGFNNFRIYVRSTPTRIEYMWESEWTCWLLSHYRLPFERTVGDAFEWLQVAAKISTHKTNKFKSGAFPRRIVTSIHLI